MHPSIPGEFLQAGDIIVGEVDNSFFFENRNEVEFSMTRRMTTERIERRDKASAAILITMGMVITVAMGWMSMLNAVLLASGLMVLTGCISLGSAGRSIEFSMTSRITTQHVERRDKASAAILITMGMVVSAAMGWMSMLNAALLAGGLMVLAGCISLASAGRSIEFSTLVVIACAIGLESSVSATGLSAIIAGALGQIGGDSAVIALIAIFTGCIVMDTLITNVASAAFMYPIAVVLAGNLGVDFMPFAVTLMVGASCSFISPMGYQTNLMVYGPGRYNFMDYVRVGVPLTVLVGIITVFLTPVVFPF